MGPSCVDLGQTLVRALALFFALLRLFSLPRCISDTMFH